MLCFVVVMQSFIMNSHEVFIHIHQGCFAGTGAIVRLPQCQLSKPVRYGKISQCITTTKHSKAKTVCIFLGIYSTIPLMLSSPCNASVGRAHVDGFYGNRNFKWVWFENETSENSGLSDHHNGDMSCMVLMPTCHLLKRIPMIPFVWLCHSIASSMLW